MIRKRVLAILLVFVCMPASPPARAADAGQAEILVSAAISLKNAFAEIGTLYEKRAGVRVRLNLGASGLLQKQIESGAPVDVFASAAVGPMDVLESKGLLYPETRRNFARNALVLVVPAGSGTRIRSFQDLGRSGPGRIGIGNPKTVPAGTYARELLGNLKLWDGLQPRLVLAENVRQVLDYVARGETEAGIVYRSDLSVASGRVVSAAFAPQDMHSPILYPICVLKETANRRGAQGFIDLVCGKEGQRILKKCGFSGD